MRCQKGHSMIFKIKPKKVKTYKHGDVITSKKFAFKPTRALKDEEVVTAWLSFYHEKRTYVEFGLYAELNGPYWVVIRSVNEFKERPKLSVINGGENV